MNWLLVLAISVVIIISSVVVFLNLTFDDCGKCTIDDFRVSCKEFQRLGILHNYTCDMNTSIDSDSWEGALKNFEEMNR